MSESLLSLRQEAAGPQLTIPNQEVVKLCGNPPLKVISLKKNTQKKRLNRAARRGGERERRDA